MFDKKKVSSLKYKKMLNAKNAKIHGYLATAKKGFSIDDIKQIGEIISKKHDSSTKLLNITVQFDDGSQSTRSTKIYNNELYENLVNDSWEAVNVPSAYDGYDDFDEDYVPKDGFKHVRFDVIAYKKVKGGASKGNNCLFFCISDAYSGKDYIPSPWNTTIKLRKQLGLTKDEKIGIEHIQTIADGMKCNFYLSGDDNSVYISKHQTNRNIHLEVKNDHFTLQTTQPVFKKSKKSLDEDIINESKNMVEHGKKHGLFYCYLSDVGSYQKLALLNFRHFCKSIDYPEDINFNEFKYLELASLGDIYYCKSRDNKLKKAYKVDVNSLYPHLLASLNSVFPIGQPEYKRIDELPSTFCSFGLYKCEMSIGTCDIELYQILRKGKYKWYTHIDINDYSKHGCKFTLIKDSMNFISYSNLVKGSHVFKPFVEKFYKAKSDKSNKIASSGFKQVLNLLWGTLCQKTFTTMKKSTISELSNYPVIDSLPVEIDDKIKYISNKTPYRNNWARIKPFLQAYSRRFMIKVITKDNLYKSVEHIKVDSIISTEKPNIPISNLLGEWKLEHEGEFEIVHTNKVLSI